MTFIIVRMERKDIDVKRVRAVFKWIICIMHGNRE